KTQIVDQGPEPAGVALELVLARACRLVREAEAHEVGDDEAQRLAVKRGHYLAVEEAPGRVAVEQEDRPARSPLHDVHAIAAGLDQAAANPVGELAGDPVGKRRSVDPQALG